MKGLEGSSDADKGYRVRDGQFMAAQRFKEDEIVTILAIIPILAASVSLACPQKPQPLAANRIIFVQPPPGQPQNSSTSVGPGLDAQTHAQANIQ
jgi:hypothetical protein